MDKLYNILAKYFQGEANDREKEQIEAYRNEKPEEFKILQKLWDTKKINPTNFDSNVAWKKLSNSKEFKHKSPLPTKTNVYPLALRWVAVAASLFIAVFFAYQQFNDDKTKLLSFTTNESQAAFKLALNDGTRVYLNKNSTLTYPESFTGDTRSVELEGEAYFEVMPNPAKPFIIATKQTDIRVLGTSFNVESDTISTTVNVVTGKVRVASISNTNTIDLLPAQGALVSADTLISFDQVNQNFLSWQTGFLEFDNAPLAAVIEDLSQFYEEEILLERQGSDCQFTTRFEKVPLEEVLDILKLSCELKIEKKEDKYIIY